jgi:tetratricopeptide (TPR) repeat protein
MYGVYAPADVMPRAKDSAVRALEIDDRLAEAHVALGCIEAVYEWQWGKSEIEFNRGIELNANYATGHHWYCVNHLVPLGRFEEANREIRRALLLDPVSLPISATIGLTHYFARDHERATKELKKTLEMDPNFPMANFFLGQVYTQRSMFDEALNHFRIALDQYGQSPNMRASYGYSAAQAGRKDITEEILSELTDLSKSQYVSSVDLAVLQLGLGQVEGALQNLQKAYEERAYMLIYLNVNPMMDDLRSHPEFEVLSQRIFHG